MWKILVWCLLAVAAAAIAVADLINPGYDPVSETVSRYVNGTGGPLITVAILAIGVASAIVVSRLRGAGRIPLAVWAAGVLVAGVFPADPPGRWDQPSTAEMVHGVAALTAFAVFPVAALLLSRTRRSRLIAVLSALATAGFAVLFIDVTDGPDLGAFGAPTLIGLVERVLIAANLLWLALAASDDGLNVGGGRRA